MMLHHRIEFFLLWGLVLIGFLLRLGAVAYGLPQSFFGDELVHVAASFTMIGEKVFRPNFSFYYLPPLFSYLLSPLFLGYGAIMVGGGFFSSIAAFKEFVLLHREYFLVFSRVVSALFGTATIWSLYYLSKSMFGRGTAFLAGIFLSFDLLHVHESQIGRIWAPTAFFFVWVLFALWKWPEHGERRWMAQAALAIGLGYGMGYIPILLLVLFIFIHMVLWHRGITSLFNKNVIYGILIVAVCVLMFSFANTYGFWRQFAGSIATIGNGLHLAIVKTPAGTSSENNFFANLSAAFVALWRDNPFLLVFGVLGAVFLFARERLSAKFVCLFLFPMLYVLVLSGISSNMDGRYLLPVLPGLFLLGGFFVMALYEMAMIGVLRFVLPIACCGVALWYGAYGVWRYDALLQKPDTRIQAISWVNQNVSEHTRIILDDHTVYLQQDKNSIVLMDRLHPQGLDTRARFLLGARDAAYPHPSYAVFDVSRSGNNEKELMDFSPDYLVYSFWTADEKRVEESKYAFWPRKQLVRLFSPRIDGTEPGADLLSDPAMAHALIPSLRSLGPSVAIYRIR